MKCFIVTCALLCATVTANMRKLRMEFVSKKHQVQRSDVDNGEIWMEPMGGEVYFRSPFTAHQTFVIYMTNGGAKLIGWRITHQSEFLNRHFIMNVQKGALESKEKIELLFNLSPFDSAIEGIHNQSLLLEWIYAPENEQKPFKDEWFQDGRLPSNMIIPVMLTNRHPPGDLGLEPADGRIVFNPPYGADKPFTVKITNLGTNLIGWMANDPFTVHFDPEYPRGALYVNETAQFDVVLPSYINPETFRGETLYIDWTSAPENADKPYKDAWFYIGEDLTRTTTFRVSCSLN